MSDLAIEELTRVGLFFFFKARCRYWRARGDMLSREALSCIFLDGWGLPARWYNEDYVRRRRTVEGRYERGGYTRRIERERERRCRKGKIKSSRFYFHSPVWIVTFLFLDGVKSESQAISTVVSQNDVEVLVMAISFKVLNLVLKAYACAGECNLTLSLEEEKYCTI